MIPIDSAETLGSAAIIVLAPTYNLQAPNVHHPYAASHHRSNKNEHLRSIQIPV